MAKRAVQRALVAEPVQLLEPTQQATKYDFMRLTEVTNAPSQANLVTRPVYIDIAKVIALHREGNRFTRIRFSGDVKNSIDVVETIEFILGMPTPTQLILGGMQDERSIPGVSTKVGEISNNPIQPDSQATNDADLGRSGNR